MPRPRKKFSIIARLKFLFSGEIQTIQPRSTRASIESANKLTDKIEKQYNNLKPIK